MELFGTDGVRGRANVHPMTAEMALALGRAVAHVFRADSRRGERHRIIIGKDTRLSGYMFEDALAAGICSMGVDVLQVGPMPTPGMAFLTTDMRCDAGVMISASHNPYQDNGIKFFGRDGLKLADALERKIEMLIGSERLDRARPGPDAIGRARRIDDAEGRYVVFLKKTFPLNLTLEGLRLVLDCGNGAAYKVAPTVLEELGAEVFRLGCEPNGRNINSDCGALHPEHTAAKVREVRAELGIALDGDADRVVLVTEAGQIIDGDAILAICARDMSERQQLSGGAVVATVMSNLGLERALGAMGLKLVRTRVGDRYVVEAMRQGGYNLGGEQSGHIVFLEHNTTGDGLMTALQVLAIMQRTGRTLSELAAVMTRFPQVLVNVAVSAKPPLESVPEVCRVLKRVEKELSGEGRVLVRYSGTEPKARVMVEGRDESRIRAFADDIASCLVRSLGDVEAKP
ncbi:MAG: phosphoglucosamine mutase [Deltaproteobacteria bacterium]|nr:MAG: phosphoglucosamine mutase [Deltaproteobacteria bacterium]